MLLAAVVDDSDSVFVDLLTYADLEALKSKRAGAPPRAAPSSKTNNKRYLILTYAAEFDRVHYPLPLLHEDAPSADALRATVARLKRENAKLAAGVVDADGGFVAAETASEGLKIIGEENAKLREENDALRAQVRQLQRELARATTDAAAKGGAALSLRGSTEYSTESRGAGSEREEHLRAELKAVTTELRLMRRERDDANRAAQAAQTEAANAESSKRRMLARKQKELDAAVADASRRRDTERELRVKVKDLSTQCDGLERRLRASGVSAYHSRPSSRAPSPGRVGYGYGAGAASPRADRPRPWRESPAGSRAATPSRARGGGDRTPTPRDSTGFRTPTHARSPSPAARGRSPTPRAAAASPGRRFDPTAYVREKQRRDEARFRNSARGIASGASTPRAAASPARERPGYGARGAGAGARGVRSPSPSAARGDIGANRRGGESPGRVLRDVKNKLADLASREGGDAGAGAGAGGAKREAGAGKPAAGKPAAGGKDASAEIADIDSRLAALQNFLKEAKSGAAGAAGGVTA